MSITERLEELRITLPECPAPLATYVPAVRSGNTITVSGQLPSVKGDFSQFCGLVPDQIPVEKAAEAARICFLNNLAAALSLVESGETLMMIQMQGFVQSSANFHEQPLVLNGASELAVQILGENGKHARTAVGVSALPKNVAVEVSCTFRVIPEPASFTGRYRWMEQF